jgi:uncharacterized protein involved in outer membrane biogenesis
MATKTVRTLWIGVAALTLLIVGIGLGLIPLNLFFAKHSITRWVQEETGWQLAIEGPLRLRLGPRPVLTTGRWSLQGSQALDAPILTAESLRIQTRLLSVLRGRPDLRKLSASGLNSRSCPFDTCPPEIWPGELQVDVEAPFGEVMRIRLAGSVRSGPVSLDAQGGELSALLDDPASFPVHFSVRGPDAVFDASGELAHPLSTPRLTARVAVELDDPAAALAPLGVTLTDRGAFDAEAAVQASLEELLLEDFEARWNDALLTGTAILEGWDDRPRLHLDARLDRLDLSPFRAAAPAEEEESLTLDTALDEWSSRLDLLDGNVQLSVGQVHGLPMDIEGIIGRATLENGRLSIDGLEMSLAGRLLRAQGQLTTREDCPGLGVRLTWDRADSALFDAWLPGGTEWRGTADSVELDWASCGRTVRAHRDSARINGSIRGLKLFDDQDPLPLALDTVEFGVAWSAEGKLDLLGSSEDEAITARVSFGSLAAILAGSNWPLSAAVEAFGYRVETSGSAALAADAPSYTGRLTASAEQFQLHADAPNAVPMTLRSELRLERGRLVAEPLDLRLGRSDVRGTLELDGPTDQGRLALHSGHLDLAELAELYPAKGSEPDEAVASRSAWRERDWLDQRLGFPALDVDWAVDRLSGLNAQVSKVRLQAEMRDRLIRDGQIRLKLADIDIDGVVQMDFRQSPGAAGLEFQLDNVNVGSLLADLGWAEGIDLHADHVDVTARSGGDTPLELANNLEFDTRIDSLNWSFELGPEDTPNHLFLSQLEISQAPGRATTWRSHGELNQAPVEALLHSPSLRDLFDQSRPLPLRLAIGTENEVGLLDLTVHQRHSDRRLARFSLSGDYSGGAGTDLSTLVPPLGTWELSGEMTVLPDRLTFDPLALTIGGSQAAGELDLSYLGGKYVLVVDLASPLLETDDLVNWAEDVRAARKLLREAERPDSKLSPEEASLANLVRDQLREISENYDLRIDFRVDELRSSGRFLGESTASARLENDELFLDLEVRLEGGDVSASYQSQPQDGNYENALAIHIERLPYGGFLRLLNPEAEARGEIFLDTRLVSRAAHEEKLVENMTGHLDLVLIPEDINAAFLDLWASNLIFALLPGSNDSRKKMNCMVARFDVVNGVMQSKNTFLDSTEIIVRARGDIDLAQRQLDLWLAPQAKTEKFLSIQAPIMVTGSFDDYQIGVAPGGLVTTMLRWFYSVIYVPWKWLTGERFPPDGIATCFNAMDLPVPEGY